MENQYSLHREQAMPKEFITERDIEELFKRGVRSLKVNESMALTQLAYEKANSLGIKLDQEHSDQPPSAPIRPYISQQSIEPPTVQPATSMSAKPPADLHARIRNAVSARLGNQINPKLLDSIIQRVLASTGLK
jgi:hypothetical protein